ncbi:hypothetical protein ACBJ59_04870 [Nonomuraea sp. MTCD27]|uniref:hypothetical protein n=1 Tax=Nonomuraea sp. MTCD27 TaxID=1676747 RepID=UPI0035C15258
MAAIATLVDMAAALKLLWIRAGRPAHRRLEEESRHDKPPLRRSSISRALRGEGLPNKDFTLALVRKYGVSAAELAQWELAWERVAMAESRAASPRPSEITELRATIAQMQQTMAAQAAELAALRDELNHRPAAAAPEGSGAAGSVTPTSGMVAMAILQQMEGSVAQVARQRVIELADHIVTNDPLLVGRMLQEMEGRIATTSREAIQRLADQILAKDPHLTGRMLQAMEGHVARASRDAIQEMARRLA